ISLSLVLAIILSPLYFGVWLAIKREDGGPALYWSPRVGAGNHKFPMPKFRSMKLDTPQVATHLLTDPHLRITRVGKFLRAYSIDELPQLWSVFKGDMSFVGPRPALFNQEDLIALRTEKGIHILKPGITGWAQINGRDELPIPEKVSLDEYYLIHRSFLFDLKILGLTFFKVIKKEGVSH
ncbi:MAG: sugar transferase, partial [Deltaproteobacteria bacterium]